MTTVQWLPRDLQKLCLNPELRFPHKSFHHWSKCLPNVIKIMSTSFTAWILLQWNYFCQKYISQKYTSITQFLISKRQKREVYALVLWIIILSWTWGAVEWSKSVLSSSFPTSKLETQRIKMSHDKKSEMYKEKTEMNYLLNGQWVVIHFRFTCFPHDSLASS